MTCSKVFPLTHRKQQTCHFVHKWKRWKHYLCSSLSVKPYSRKTHTTVNCLFFYFFITTPPRYLCLDFCFTQFPFSSLKYLILCSIWSACLNQELIWQKIMHNIEIVHKRVLCVCASPKECATVVLELKKRPSPRSPSFTSPVAVINTLAGLISGLNTCTHWHSLQIHCNSVLNPRI